MSEEREGGGETEAVRAESDLREGGGWVDLLGLEGPCEHLGVYSE